MKRIAALWPLLTALALMGTGLLSATPAKAQFNDNGTSELSRNWSLRLGLWIPQSQTTRNAMGTVGISGALQRQVYTATNYSLLLGIGYNGYNRVYSVPVMMDMVLHHHNLLYGGGVGYSFGKRDNGRGTNGVAIDLMVGYQLTHTTNPLDVDLRYFFVSGSSNELDGYGITLGYHF